MEKKQILAQIALAGIIGSLGGMVVAYLTGYNMIYGCLAGAFLCGGSCAPKELCQVIKNVSITKIKVKSDALTILFKYLSKVVLSIVCYVWIFGSVILVLCITFELATVFLSKANELNAYWFSCFPMMGGLAIWIVFDYRLYGRRLSYMMPFSWSLEELFGFHQIGNGKQIHNDFVFGSDNGLFKWHRLFKLIGATVALMIMNLVLIVLPLFFSLDLIFTVLLATATTKRLSAITGTVIGIICSIAVCKYLGAPFALGILLAVVLSVGLGCGLYITRKSLEQSRWPWQKTATVAVGV